MSPGEVKPSVYVLGSVLGALAFWRTLRRVQRAQRRERIEKLAETALESYTEGR